MMRNAIKILPLVLAISTSLFADTGALQKIVDGDTLHFYSKGRTVKCRIAWIDTPESHYNQRAKRKVRQCSGMTLSRMVEAGREATEHAKTLVRKGKTYRFEITGRDRYGRDICVVRLPDGETFNERMVVDGYAAPFWKYIPHDMDRKFRKLSNRAKRQSAGLWQGHESVMRCLLQR